MVRKPVVRIVLVLSVLTLVGIVALAAAGRHGIVASQDGRQTIATHGPSSHIKPWIEPDAGLTTIAGNLSKYQNGVFFCCYGFTISGPTSIIGSTYWAAVPFTPTANSTVKKVEVAVGYVTGTNGVTVSVNADAGGVPGAQLAGGNFTGLENYGDCCQLVVASGHGGVAVNQGTQYWVVVSTSSGTSDTWDAWAFNSTDMRLFPIAGYNNGVWSAGQNLLPGYAVLGTQ